MVHCNPYEVFLQLHKSQLVTSGVPELFWLTLYRKISNNEFDAGNSFSLLQIDYEGEKSDCDPLYSVQVKVEDGIKHNNPENIFLIDHAWTFRIDQAKKHLEQIDVLRERMALMMGINLSLSKNEVVEKIYESMWKFCNFYSIGNAENIEDRMPVWYVTDEVGSAVIHSNTPNFRLVPFVYIPDKMTYSLLFPITDVELGDFVSRDFVEGVNNEERKALLLPWVQSSFDDKNFQHITPNIDYFLSGHLQETLPILSKLQQSQPKKLKYKVFTEYKLIEDYLTDDYFEIVNNEESANILWYTKHFKNFKELSETPYKFVNQFPFEYVLTIKDLLCVTCRRLLDDKLNLDNSPLWLPITYNLKTELIQFVNYYQNCEKEGLDNHWIIKPFNLARGLDIHITKNINCILKLSMTGPKIAQKYIENPVLFERPECNGKVKFDVRYVILLKSVKPLKVYIYKNFFLRFANKPFELNNFDDYEKHFTVMNYNENVILKHMLCENFKLLWEKQYPDILWNDIENDICVMLHKVFKCAILEEPPCGISENPQSRALYAADIMLEFVEQGKKIQPKLLEINWTPDCKRACEYYPNFYNDIFKLLFLDEENIDAFYEL